MNKIFALMLFLMTIFGWGGYIDGSRWWNFLARSERTAWMLHYVGPVVTPMEITDTAIGTEYLEATREIVPFVDLYFTMEKMRDCNFRNLSFRRANGATIEYLNPDVLGGSRSTGKHVIGPYRLLRVSELQVRKMRVFTEHDGCRWRPWTVYTDFTPEPQRQASMVPFLMMAGVRSWFALDEPEREADWFDVRLSP